MGTRLQGHGLARQHTGAGCVLHLAIHRDKTGVNVVLGLGARATDVARQALGQADGLGV